MKHFAPVLLMFFSLGISFAFAQVSPDCGNAIPICNNTPINGGTIGFGIDDFNGSATSGCLEQTLSGAIESNSAWYRFRTGASGQLGFNIGIDSSEDWDFALYKSNDCANLGDPIRCNFFDNQDENSFIGVGEDPTGDMANFQYDTWLDVAPGEDYYLLINNFSNNNTGFSIQFSGSIFLSDPYTALDCSIINNLLGPPITACENEIVQLDATTANSIDYNWFIDLGSGFQLIIGENSPTLQVSTSAAYRVEVITSTGANIISDVQVFFTPKPVGYSITDDANCSGVPTYDLSIKDSEALGNQDPNQYIVTYYTSLADATNGSNSLPKNYNLGFVSQTIYVRVAALSNPKCFDVSQQFQLTALESPAINFQTEVYLCNTNGNATLGDLTPNPSYTYLWDTGETTSSLVVSDAGLYSLTITNSLSGLSCESTAVITVFESQPPKITDVLIDDLKSDNTVTVVLQGSGDYEFKLDNGDYQASTTWNGVAPGMHTITVNDRNGCGMVSEEIVVVGFPRYFTPNGDNTNDKWTIEGLSTLLDPVVYIFDRQGKLLKQITDQDPGWDGTMNGQVLPSSDYWFKLTYKNTVGEQIIAKYVNSHFSLKR
ncbi:MAG: T9SS type B sorting domain-containing protein [Maribacter sp.]|nr:T9SS type B sorting domain-containing protein [Maribacter sp.]